MNTNGLILGAIIVVVAMAAFSSGLYLSRREQAQRIQYLERDIDRLSDQLQQSYRNDRIAPICEWIRQQSLRTPEECSR